MSKLFDELVELTRLENERRGEVGDLPDPVKEQGGQVRFQSWFDGNFGWQGANFHYVDDDLGPRFGLPTAPAVWVSLDDGHKFRAVTVAEAYEWFINQDLFKPWWDAGLVERRGGK